MASITLTPSEIAALKQLSSEGKLSEAWQLLGNKGDAYAFLAGKIVADNTANMSAVGLAFYEMVGNSGDSIPI